MQITLFPLDRFHIRTGRGFRRRLRIPGIGIALRIGHIGDRRSYDRRIDFAPVGCRRIHGIRRGRHISPTGITALCRQGEDSSRYHSHRHYRRKDRSSNALPSVFLHSRESPSACFTIFHGQSSLRKVWGSQNGR